MVDQEEHRLRRYRQRYLDERLSLLELSAPQGIFLTQIDQHQPIKMNHIIEMTPFHKSHATRNIQQLSERGLVVKTIDPEDNRGYLLSVTEAGSAIAKRVIQALDDWERLCNEALSESEMALLAIIKNKIFQHVNNYFKEESHEESL
jgi:DNA-binding MarR family transcriptional regulator